MKLQMNELVQLTKELSITFIDEYRSNIEIDKQKVFEDFYFEESFNLSGEEIKSTIMDEEILRDEDEYLCNTSTLELGNETLFISLIAEQDMNENEETLYEPIVFVVQNIDCETIYISYL